MKKFLLLAVLIPSVSSAGLFGPDDPRYDKEWDVYTRVTTDLHRKFTWISDMDKWGEESHVETDVTGDEPFTGDCEEYAIAALVQTYREKIPAMPRVVQVNGVSHMIACGKYWCLDNLHPGAFQIP